MSVFGLKALPEERWVVVPGLSVAAVLRQQRIMQRLVHRFQR
ncbi:hypothetical protein [Rhizocola hellebori]|nr:hypothetical protein [Rhizocola hellebori]